MTSKIRIKLIARGRNGSAWSKQLPQDGTFTGECEFLFSKEERDYYWLVVIDDVSRSLKATPEILNCAEEHTLFVTTEPPTITRYGKGFCSQFAQVLTSQPPEALQHPNRIYSHTGNLWFNGHGYEALDGKPFPEKTAGLSTVCSSKQQKHTIHNDRYQFCHWLMQEIPSMGLFGHGSRYVENKFDALDPYRFHLAIENYSGLHHWTEKLADPYLSGCFPIYYGCPNLGDYFPEQSFLQIDIFNRPEALEKIRSVLGDETFFEKRQDALHEARRRVMREHNLLFMIENLVVNGFDTNKKSSGKPLFNRKQMRVRHPADAIRHLKWHIGRYLK